MTDPTVPEGIVFRSLDPALIRVRLLSLIVSVVVLSGIASVAAWVLSPYVWAFVAVIVIIHVWLMWLVPRQVRAMGYYEGEHDFLIRKGIMFKSLTVIPYGRIQFVDVNEGPIARWYGMTTMTLHTASAETAGSLDGLPAVEAARLRDMLAHRGASEQAGL